MLRFQSECKRKVLTFRLITGEILFISNKCH